MGPLAIREVPISEFLTVCKRAQGPVCDSSPIFSMHSARPRAHLIFSTRDSAVMGGGRVRSPSGSSALVGLNLRPYRKAGRLEDWPLPVPDRSSKPPRLVEPVLKRAIEAQKRIPAFARSRLHPVALLVAGRITNLIEHSSELCEFRAIWTRGSQRPTWPLRSP
jgi:hypothetical protein